MYPSVRIIRGLNVCEYNARKSTGRYEWAKTIFTVQKWVSTFGNSWTLTCFCVGACKGCCCYCTSLIQKTTWSLLWCVTRETRFNQSRASEGCSKIDRNKAPVKKTLPVYFHSWDSTHIYRRETGGKEVYRPFSLAFSERWFKWNVTNENITGCVCSTGATLILRYPGLLKRAIG